MYWFGNAQSLNFLYFNWFKVCVVNGFIWSYFMSAETYERLQTTAKSVCHIQIFLQQFSINWFLLIPEPKLTLKNLCSIIFYFTHTYQRVWVYRSVWMIYMCIRTFETLLTSNMSFHQISTISCSGKRVWGYL